ncbi:PRC-barrel domain-containing protein [Anditalea andensis]|uniref:PRC-barrel domain-containing protein n=1 Tax=Anditalea andensis TaxID=1048983 RepID=A0A074KWU0_9BACT|nr:PRC-barrel domain-containing protein [Anditalea andensis]KEO72063.1 hypothetical protein EL17_19315 [Anditalea andensis]
MKDPNNAHLLRSTDLSSRNVKNLRDEDIGSIKDVILYPDGQVAYVVLAVGTGFLNMNNKYFAIPWESLSFTRAERTDEDLVTLDVDKEKLENAPGFDDDNWPTGPQTDFVNSIHKHYGTTSLRREGSY